VDPDKLRLDDPDDKLKKHGKDGWELVSLNLDADLKGSWDGQEWPGSALPTELDNGRRSPRRKLTAVVRLLGPQALKRRRAQL
jgi:hypothetical protein